MESAAHAVKSLLGSPLAVSLAAERLGAGGPLGELNAVGAARNLQGPTWVLTRRSVAFRPSGVPDALVARRPFTLTDDAASTEPYITLIIGS